MRTMRYPIVLLALLVLSFATRPCAADVCADSVAFLSHDLAIAEAGPATLVQTVVLSSHGPCELLLPFGFARARDFTVQGRDVTFAPAADGTPQPLHDAAARRLLALRAGPGAQAGDTVVIRCVVDGVVDWKEARGEFGVHELERTFVNDADLSVGSYRMTLRVPEGFLIRRIASSEPAFKAEKSPTPPYVVGRTADRGFATIKAAGLRPGGRVRFAVQAEPVRRGSVPLVGGLLLVVLYLWGFRDLVVRREHPNAPNAAPLRRPS